MANFIRNIICKYLDKFGYNVKNQKGDTCLLLNLLDMLFLFIYIGIVIYNVSISGINNNNSISSLTYVATAIISLRTLIKFSIKGSSFKKYEVSITHIICIVVYLIITVFLIIGYFFFYNKEMAKVFLIIYYILYAIFEVTEIFTKIFEAEPHIYKR